MEEKYIRFAADKLSRAGFTDIQYVSDDEQGADILATAKSGAHVCIKCVYTDKPVTANAVNEAYQAKKAYGCNAAMVITNSTFTEKAEEFAGKAKVSLKAGVEMTVQSVSTPAPISEKPKGVICPACGSYDVEIKLMQENLGSTTITKTKGKTKSGHGCLWWCVIGWWWIFIDAFMWVFAFPVRLVIQLFFRKKSTTKSKTISQELTNIEYKTMCLCRECGHHWEKT